MKPAAHSPALANSPVAVEQSIPGDVIIEVATPKVVNPFAIKPGDKVAVLSDYELSYGTAVRVNAKSITVDMPARAFFRAHTARPDPAKVARVDEPIAVVWETWRGVNGRGGYRLDRDMYVAYHKPAGMYVAYHKPAGKWPHQALVTEDAYGVVSGTHGL